MKAVAAVTIDQQHNGCLNRGKVATSLSQLVAQMCTPPRLKNAVYPFKYEMTQASIMVIFQRCYIIAPARKKMIPSKKEKAKKTISAE